eukprot:CAMPEP_0117439660 /NCGR_PEP_ID=MMETSP0759-20121206/2678_1 /TAXON_ID=63605 /ORGANISM="Percolomonas cosmopolitus, Strain WS" /LENGTH=322 /DNA_ID=CAMNT_0005231379 /DNA_START=5 /DNA_END=973 /DNA_ORIENTATION=+
MSISQFLKESSLPIPVPSEPHFSHFLNLYESHLQSKSKYDTFTMEQKVSSSAQEVRKEVVSHVEKNQAYQQFIASSLESFTMDQNFVAQFKFVGSIYSKMFENQYFVSIDMKKGNFTSMQFVDPRIVDNADTYEQFLSKFTDNEHVIRSKKIRQVIFGHLEPKKQQTVQKKIMEQLMRLIVDSGLFTAEQFKVFTNDEIILQCDSRRHLRDMIPKLHHLFATARVNDTPFSKVQLHVEAFLLTSISAASGKTLGFKKEFVLSDQEENEGKPQPEFVLKGVPAFLYAQVYKQCIGEPIQKMDRAFLHQKILCHATNVFEVKRE